MIWLHFSSTPKIQNALDLRVQDLARQAVRRDAIAQHAAGLAESLKHGHGITASRELIGAGKARRPGAYDGDLLFMLFFAQSRASLRPFDIPKSPTNRSSALMATAPSFAIRLHASSQG